MVLAELGFVVFLILTGIGLLLCLFGLAGTIAVAVGAIAYWALAGTLTVWHVVWLLALVLLGEILEVIISSIGARGGMSRHAVYGSLIGAVAGAMLSAGIFIFVGVPVGAVCGAWIGEYLHSRSAARAFNAARVAVWTRILVSAEKLIIAIAMIVLTVVWA